MSENWYKCAYCGRRNEVFVDPSAGAHQQYVEDCQVCCRPNLLTVEMDEETGTPIIRADREND